MNSLMEMVYLRKRKWINYSYYWLPFRTHSIPLRKHGSNINNKLVLLYEYIMVDQVLQNIFFKIYIFMIWVHMLENICQPYICNNKILKHIISITWFHVRMLYKYNHVPNTSIQLKRKKLFYGWCNCSIKNAFCKIKHRGASWNQLPLCKKQCHEEYVA